MGIRVAVLVSALLVLSVTPALGADIRPALAPTPNRSIALYKAPGGGKPGRLWTGVMANGVFVQKKATTTGRWSDIAVGRDTMALYDNKSGKLVTGTFKAGLFKQKASRTIAKGYSHMAASCDSLALYKTDSGQLLTAELTSGQYRDPRKTNVGPGANLMDASCDTLYLIDGNSSGSSPFYVVGRFNYGHFDHQDNGFEPVVTPRVILATNRTSFVHYDPASLEGSYGALTDGIRSNLTNTVGFRFWDLIAGVGDDILFYRKGSGLTGGWILLQGDVTGRPDGSLKQRGLTLIAGGR